ncbi:hypothetical protein PP178_08290 [Zeaxanthinibacter sp. PT1]|uniref:hypothetical protein n=1 Tax=Zeaxanthinibacter TaxID=561554 RepID=UPI00234BFBC4|nr:hypothetical protein [Zeaxanthinibacter sp. PT1]MDC6351552.1 hypothetical protein [Zeaxanthinibacter sp. PT1]
MQYLYSILGWKRCLILSIGVLALLIILNFYGLYSNRFYFLKLDNYIFPLLSLLHFTFLYVFWFKIKEQEFPDPRMRNLEYSLYVIFVIYVFNTLETGKILLSHHEYSQHLIPPTFFPVGGVIIALQCLLLLLTLVTFGHRKRMIGDYKTDYLDDHLEPWD